MRLRADGQADLLMGECIAAHEASVAAWVITDDKHYLVHLSDVVDVDDDAVYAAFGIKFDQYFPQRPTEEDAWKDGNDFADAVEKNSQR